MSAAAAAGVSQMSGLTSDKQSAAAAAMQFPLTQRRRRKILFTQVQVSTGSLFSYWFTVALGNEIGLPWITPGG